MYEGLWLLIYWLLWLSMFVCGSFRPLLGHCSRFDAESSQFCPKRGRMLVFSCCAIMFSIPCRSDWQVVFWKRGGASSCTFLTGEAHSELSGTGSGGGAGSRNANTWVSRHRIRLVHVILTSKSATIQFQPESLSSRWSTSKILRASDIRLDACGVSKVH